MAELQKKVPGAILSGLVRVDMMKYGDRIILNEFESLEATFYAMDSADTNGYEASTMVFLAKYWHSKFTEALDICGELGESPLKQRKSKRTSIQTHLDYTPRPPSLFVKR